MNVSLGRIIFYVQDVSRLAEFYRDAFGLPVVEEIKGEWAVLRAGSCEIALHRVGKPYRVADPSSWQVATNAKLVLTVDRELTELRAELIARACRWARSNHIPASPARSATGRTRRATRFNWRKGCSVG
jgi:hypothetical protein